MDSQTNNDFNEYKKEIERNANDKGDIYIFKIDSMMMMAMRMPMTVSMLVSSMCVHMVHKPDWISCKITAWKDKNL